MACASGVYDREGLIMKSFGSEVEGKNTKGH